MDENKNVDMIEVAEEDLYRIPSDKIQMVADEFDKAVVVDWHDYKLLVRKTITQYEMTSFVDAVVKSCFDDDGTYMPENRDFMYRYCQILFYTNIDLPRDSEEAYELVYLLDLNNIINANAERYQLADIQSAIEEKIRYRLDTELDEMRKQVERITQVVGALNECISSVDAEDIKNLVTAYIEKGGLDEQKIVEALFKDKEKVKDDGKSPT